MPKGKSYAIALSGILSAVCILLMFCTALFPMGMYILPAVAGVVVWLVYRETSRKWAILCYAAVSVLSLLLTPEIESKLLFLCFFGYYPTVRDIYDRIKPKAAAFAVRLISFNVPVVLLYLVLINVLGMNKILEDFGDMGDFAALAFLGMGNFFFIMYDVTVAALDFFYDTYIKKRVKRIIK